MRPEPSQTPVERQSGQRGTEEPRAGTPRVAASEAAFEGASEATSGAASEAASEPGKGSFVADLTEGAQVEGVFLVRRKSTRRTRDGRPYLGLVLYDRTGAVDGQVWDDAQAFGVAFSERDFLRVRGVVERFRERLQLRVATCVRVRWEDLSPEDFLPASGRPPGEMRTELRVRIRGLANPYLRALLERVEGDPGLMNALALSPAASTVHHDAVGGLLEHTLSLMALADAVARVYRDLDRDLLLAGAFLHDLGKVRELEATPGFPYTDEGQLLGHIVIGYDMAMRLIDGIPGFPPELRLQVGHLVLSHQGELEWGSPKEPQTLEAVVLHFLDNLDSKVNVVRKALGGISAEGEGEVGDEEAAAWTEYVRTLGRSFYRGARPAGRPKDVGSEPPGRPGRVADPAPDLFGPTELPPDPLRNGR